MARPPPLKNAIVNRRMRRTFVILLILMMLGIGVFPAAYLVERWRGRAAWRAYEQEAKQRGLKLEIGECLGPPVPDAENFAKVPIFEDAFRTGEDGQPVPNPFELFKKESAKRPKLAMPIKQQRIDLVAWQKFFVEEELLAEAGSDAAQDVLAAIDTFKPYLDQLHQAGSRAHCRFPVKWEDAYEARTPHYAILQVAAAVFALRLNARLTRGDSTAAYQDFHDGLRLAAGTAAEPSLLAGLIRINTAATIEYGLWNGLAGHRWTEPELIKIETDLAQFDWLKDCIFALESERVLTNRQIDLAMKNPHELNGLIESQGSKRGFGPMHFYPTGWFFHSKVRYDRYIEEMVAAIDLEHRRFHGDTPKPSAPVKGEGTPKRMYFFMFELMSSVLVSIPERFVQSATTTDLARLACALERYWLAHGVYPAQLSDLEPSFIPRVPLEIVNGEPYRYRRENDGRFVLYSVGIDLRDDGGLLDPNAKATKQKDWVWQYPP